MTQIEKIIAEIERLMNWKPKAIPSGMRQRDVLNIRKGVLLTLKDFINALPAEHPSEDLGIDEELKRFFEINNLFVDANDLQTVRHCNSSPVDKRYYFEDIARHFAQWQKEQMMKSAIDAVIVNDEMSGCVVDCEQGCLVLEPHTYPIGQKLKILIIKEDEQ